MGANLSVARRLTTATCLAVVALYATVLPLWMLHSDLTRDSLQRGNIPLVAWRVHRALTPRFERWAPNRVAQAAGARVSHEDVPATEWPMFSTVFYLVATENMEDASTGEVVGEKPMQYAAGAVAAAAALLLDPANATWVRFKWGEDYLHHDNVFYRMLLIRGLTSHARLAHDASHLDLLRDQVESLATDLDAAASGFLDDYPRQAYPSDVVWAVAAIRAADAVLGTDHGSMAARFIEKCQRPAGLGRLGLLPYQIDAPTGRALDDSRGCSNSGLLMYLPDLMPALAARLYDRYTAHFWQERFGTMGFREFPRDVDVDRWWDVDAGPVIFGYGLSATAFGIGAARANGRLDHAVPLTALAIAASWPLPDGTLLLPRLLSHATEAPYLGEAGMLFILTRSLPSKAPLTMPIRYPWVLYAILAAYGGAAFTLLWAAVQEIRRLYISSLAERNERWGNVLWIACVIIGVVAFSMASWRAAAAGIAVACALPNRVDDLRWRSARTPPSRK